MAEGRGRRGGERRERPDREGGIDQQVGIPTIDPPRPAAAALRAQRRRRARINAISSVDPRQWDLEGGGVQR